MDQIKIGKFIQTCRKNQNLTQRELADKLEISDKTISKWETGNGLPEVSLMVPLCEILEVTVNELLSGEKLKATSYQQKAEENIVALLAQKEEAKKKIILASVVCFITLLGAITIIMLAGYLNLKTWLRVLLIVIAFVVIILGIAVCCVLERDAGVYECTHCGEKFVPSMKGYVFGAHTLTRRKLTCPKCGKKSYCKKRLG